jgi:hypothetical protein
MKKLFIILFFLMVTSISNAEIFKCSACISEDKNIECIPHLYTITPTEEEGCSIALGSAKIGEFNSKDTYLVAGIIKKEQSYVVAFGYQHDEIPGGFYFFAATSAFKDRKNSLYLLDDSKAKIAKLECVVE